VASVASFIRNTPAGTVKAYFKKTGIGLRPAVDWGATEPAVVRDLLSAFAGMATADRTRVENDIDRVAAIADEPGQVALYSVTQDRAQLDTLRNPNDRALWMFLNEPDAFRRAEEVRFTASADAVECGTALCAPLISPFIAMELRWMLSSAASADASKR
jgi:hypothetical protein